VGFLFYCRWLQPTELLDEVFGFSQKLQRRFWAEAHNFKLSIPLAEANGNEFPSIVNPSIVSLF
jgi:hypothetical protein